MAPDDDLQVRTARNEAIFRDVNEALRAGHWPGDEDAPITFRCECGELGCSRMIDLTAREYERIRANPRRFFVARDHHIPEAESVVERHDSHLVVQKQAQAGRIAEATDPRS
jgi:hypothetical protein